MICRYHCPTRKALTWKTFESLNCKSPSNAAHLGATAAWTKGEKKYLLPYSLCGLEHHSPKHSNCTIFITLILRVTISEFGPTLAGQPCLQASKHISFFGETFHQELPLFPTLLTRCKWRDGYFCSQGLPTQSVQVATLDDLQTFCSILYLERTPSWKPS